MSHKVHPKAYRIKRIDHWDTRGFYRNPAESLAEDYKIRTFLLKKVGDLGVEKIEIERFATKINIIINSARPGLIIGRGGEGIENLKKELEQKIMSKSLSLKKAEGTEKKKRDLRVEIREVKDPWFSAALAGQAIAQQIEKRMPFRRVLKQALEKIRANKDAKGAKVEVSGRLNGAEISRREWLKSGQLPLQTIRADIDYARVTARCTYGAIGIKVWIYKGEKFE